MLNHKKLSKLENRFHMKAPCKFSHHLRLSEFSRTKSVKIARKRKKSADWFCVIFLVIQLNGRTNFRHENSEIKLVHYTKTWLTFVNALKQNKLFSYNPKRLLWVSFLSVNKTCERPFERLLYFIMVQVERKLSSTIFICFEAFLLSFRIMRWSFRWGC